MLVWLVLGLIYFRIVVCSETSLIHLSDKTIAFSKFWLLNVELKLLICVWPAHSEIADWIFDLISEVLDPQPVS